MAKKYKYTTQRKDKKTPMVLTRLAKQASVLNAEALNILAQPLLQDHFGKEWLVRMCKNCCTEQGLTL